MNRNYKNSSARCAKRYILELLKDLIPTACSGKRKTQRSGRLETAGMPELM